MTLRKGFSLQKILPLLILTLALTPLSAANRVKTVVTGEVILAADWNAEFDNIYADVTHTISGTWTFDKAGTPITITPASAPAANTLLVDVQNTGGSKLWSLDYEGDIIRGNGAAVDVTSSIDGAAQDFYYCLDDSVDDLIFGLGSTCGTTPVLHIDQNQRVLISQTALSALAQLHVKSPAITVPNIITDTEDLYISTSYEARYNGEARIRHSLTATVNRIELAAVDLGDDIAGPELRIGRNTNGSNANPGTVKLFETDGTAQFLWADPTGDLRIGTAAPASATTDTSGIEVGAQTSGLYDYLTGELSKNLIAPATPDEGLNTILKTKYWHYDYISGKSNGTQFIGTYAEISPWMMKDLGRSFNPVNATSYNSLAIQKLNQKIESLTLELRRLNRGP
jgi:hypothetical protein